MIKSHKASEFLQTPEDVAAYLNATIEEMDDSRLLMKAFRNIAEAQGSVSELSRRAKVDRVAGAGECGNRDGGRGDDGIGEARPGVGGGVAPARL